MLLFVGIGCVIASLGSTCIAYQQVLIGHERNAKKLTAFSAAMNLIAFYVFMQYW